MKLDKLIVGLFICVIVLIVFTLGFTYRLYNNLCNNSEVYTAVKEVDSTDAYAICGKKFGIVNTGETEILVTKQNNVEQDDQENGLIEVSQNDNTVLIESGDTYPIEASDQITYTISNPEGSNLEHKIEVRKF